ncbi:hypothetical protein H072_4990 [Dactylellina haptotyla CBS 200.50]|uniref:Ubiquitin 3 binding protein But2 C-terminal domain-containing protein n=1 Tax=Dactylellina haptotyla (strain CBS 200.50) TaxID=1284197 RepID=S8ADS0_DACHA|nr:hypothetical protein H072_4990 [Dactylellina haptotyla CBS 200.50]
MKTLAILPFVALAAAHPADIFKRDCSGNNCLRAVRASAFLTRSGTADCSSYFRTTATPATSTFYETVHETTITNTAEATVTVTVGPPGATIKKRVEGEVLDIPTEIPGYATACSGSVAYSSACSCIGVTGTTITVAAPSTTITVTTSDIGAEVTSTVTLTATTVRLQFAASPTTYGGAYVASKTLADGVFVVPTADPVAALNVAIQPDGSVTSPDGKVLVGKQSTIDTDAHFLLWVTPEVPLPVIYFPVSCSLGAGSALSCTDPSGFTQFGGYYLADHKDTIRLFAPSVNLKSDPNKSRYVGPLSLTGV